ncbi:MAG: hypothetical protein JOZ51_24145, partial [Chloroflexi bacterium]|nr:hypothetical protein [Chloroflexota bacterium]
NTTTGAMLQSVAVADRQMYTVRPVLPYMALSPDGAKLYVLKLHTPTPGNDQISLATFDTAKGTFGPDQPLAGCMGASLVTSGDQVAVLCAGSHQLRVIAGGKNAGAETTVTLPSNGSANASEQAVAHASAAVPAANGTFAVVLGNGRIYNVGGGQSIQSQTALNQSSDLWVPHGNVAASADGSKLFVGLGAVAERGRRATETIVILDAKTGKQISSVKSSQSFWSMSVDRSGSQIYTVHPEQQSVTVIDVSTQQAVTTLRNLGVSPVQVAIAP